MFVEIEMMGVKMYATFSDKLGASNSAATRRDNFKIINVIVSDVYVDVVVILFKICLLFLIFFDFFFLFGFEVLIVKSVVRYAYIARLFVVIALVNSVFFFVFIMFNVCVVVVKFKLLLM